MRGFRNIHTNGTNEPLYGYIKDNKFVYTDIDCEFNLEGGKVVESNSIQSGGMCFIDYIEMENGGVYLITDEAVNLYDNIKTFNAQFWDDTLDYLECQIDGRITSPAFPDPANERTNTDWIKHEGIYNSIYPKQNIKNI